MIHSSRTAVFSRKITVILLCVLWFALIHPVQAQTDTPAPRKKVALVLEGGAAFGLAHLGVIRWLEEHRIPVDIVTGTSMGALVGGAYATGMTPPEMQKLLRGIDWNTAFNPGTAYSELSFRRKEDRRYIASLVRVGLKHGPRLSPGFTAAQPIGGVLSRISLPFSSLTTFDDLPIPFRCVATDLTTGEAVVLHDGPLATALRGTMAIPGIFTPVPRDGRLLADGGIVNNNPTDVAKAMGADYIISVTLDTGPALSGSAISLVDVVAQLQYIIVQNNVSRNLPLADVVLRPELKGLQAFDFPLLDTFVKRGYASAQTQAAHLLPLALDETSWKSYLATRRARRPEVPLTPRFVRVEGVSSANGGRLEKRLHSFLGKPLEPLRLERELIRITGEGRYESLLYERTEENGNPGLLIRAAESNNGPPFLNLGTSIQSLNRNEVSTTLRSRVTALGVGPSEAEVRADFQAGSSGAATAEYYQPLGSRHFFLAPRIFYQDASRTLYQNGSSTAIYNGRTGGVGLDLGHTANSRNEVRIGFQAGRSSYNVRTGASNLPSLSGRFRAASARWVYDDQTAPFLPERGSRGVMAADWYFAAAGATKAFPLIRLEGSKFVPSGDRNTVYGLIGYGTGLGYAVPPSQQFSLGGPGRLSALHPDEVVGSDYGLISMGCLRTVGRLPFPVGERLLVGVLGEYGGAGPRLFQSRFVGDIGIAAVAETILGPVTGGISFSDRGRHNLYFSVGQLF